VTAGRSPHRTLAPDTVGPEARKPTSRRGIADQAKADKPHRCRDLYGCLNVELLLACWSDLNQDAASGVDGVTGQGYAEHLQANVEALVERLKKKRYRAKLMRRRYIPKGNGQERPLGIPVIADKLLQAACARLLNAIYEQEFLGCSYGYRPERGAGEAVRDLTVDWHTGGRDMWGRPTSKAASTTWTMTGC
jgi:RNA-directed DNA polymerase